VRNPASETARPAHGDLRVVALRVAAVAIRAGEPGMAVNIVAEGEGRRLKTGGEYAVAFHAGVLRRGSSETHRKQGYGGGFHRQYPRIENTDR
jgi:hypothetical protein